MEDEFGANVIVITDEDGKEYELEELATVIYNDKEYLALIPADAQDDEDLEVSILRRDTENGEEVLSAVDDDAELEAVFNLLLFEEDGQDE